MNIRSSFRLFLVLVLVRLAATPAQAQIKITEVMSSSGTTADWFELTNFGAAPVNVTGYKMDDNSNSFALSVSLNGVTSIGVNESVVFMESSAPGTDIPAFRTFWGNIPSIQIGNYSGSGVSLSSSGDDVHVFLSGGSQVDGVTFGAATSGVSFGYNTTTNTFGALSVAGQFGAFQSADATHNIGSPGTIGLTTVPEPGTSALLAGLAALGVLATWHHRRAKAA